MANDFKDSKKTKMCRPKLDTDKIFSDIQIQIIKRECHKIRSLMETASKEQIVKGYLSGFPAGRCGLTCRVLGPWLIGLFPNYDYEYVCGFHGRQSHAWIEMNNLIIDITADQFDNISEPVIVTYDHSFHDTFTAKIYRKLSIEDMSQYPESKIFKFLQEHNYP